MIQLFWFIHKKLFTLSTFVILVCLEKNRTKQDQVDGKKDKKREQQNEKKKERDNTESSLGELQYYSTLFHNIATLETDMINVITC